MKNKFNLKLYFILLTASIISTIAVLPYAFTLAGDALQSEIAWPFFILITIVQSSILFAIVIFFGIIISKKVGLSIPVIEDYIQNNQYKQRIKFILSRSIPIGIATGMVIILIDIIFYKSGVAINLWTGQMPPFWMGFLASFYGGIGEEILLRLFFMSFIVWLFSKFNKDKNIINNNILMWSAIMLSSIIFGLGHLPITSTVVSLTPLVIVRAITLNGIGGMVFGWLYWKNGLESAMVAHFSADLALHMILPLLLSITS